MTVAGGMLFGLSDASLWAGAWSQQKGQGLAITTYRYYGTHKVFSGSGSLVKSENGGHFTKNEANLYLEYGVTNNITLLGNFFLQHVSSSDRVSGRDSNFGLSQQEVGARWQFSNKPVAQSFQLLVGFPGGSDATPVLDNNQWDFELDYFIAKSFKCLGRDAFVELGGGPRFRTGAPADQLRWFATLGYSITHQWQIFGQLEGTHGLGNDSPQTVGNNVTVTTNYTLLKAGLTVAYNINDRWALSAGPFIHYYGKNTGAGGGVQAAVWYRF